MKLALECSTKLLEMVQPFADFDWILGHLYLRDKKYAEFYKASKKMKFIDNSVNEEGEPITIDKLKKVYEDLGGGYIVSPDWIGDSEKTLKAYAECIQVFGDANVVGVIQGSTFEEAFACLAAYKGMVAVPYDICSKKDEPPWVMSLRRVIVTYRIPPTQYTHLLGFTTLDEFALYQGLPNVASVDTGVPIWLGLEGLGIEEPLKDKKDPTYKKMEELEVNAKAWSVVLRNLALLRRYIS